MPAPVGTARPLFQAPARIDMPLWRYVSLARFVSMLQTQCLTMVPAALMEDRFEGSFPLANNPSNRLDRILEGEVRKPAPAVRKVLEADMMRITKNLRTGVQLSCWHASETESVAMWKLYAPESLCLMSDYRSLCGVLKAPTASSDDCPAGEFRVGEVSYINFHKGSIDLAHGLAPFMHKRAEFAHEREVRALYLENGPADPPTPKQVPIALRDLIHAVVPAPGTRPWFWDCISGLLTTYGLTIPINRSALDGPVIP